MPHEIPHLFFFIICERERGVGFECCVFECGEGLCWLSWLEDGGFFDDVAWWSHLVGGVDGYEFFLDGLGEDLSDANVVVVDCFAAAFLAEQGECVFDVAAGELIERESTDLLVDLVDFGLVGFEDAWFDLCAYAVEPTLRVLFEGGDGFEGEGAFGLEFFDFAVEFFACFGFGCCDRGDEATLTCFRVGADFSAQMPFAFVILPEGACAFFASWCIYFFHDCWTFSCLILVFARCCEARVGASIGASIGVKKGAKRAKSCIFAYTKTER